MKNLSIFLSFLLFSFYSFAQENNKDITVEIVLVPHYRGAFGVSAGMTTGLGLTYIYFPCRFGIQVSALPIKTQDLTFYSGAITGYYTLEERRYFNTYLYLGNHLVYRYEKYGYQPNYPFSVPSEDTEYNVGFGVGFITGKKIAFRFMAGYAVYDVTNTVNFYPAVETGLYYRF